MTLVGANWSYNGRFRAGGSIDFDGASSYGVAKSISLWDEWGPDMTLGLTMHPQSVSSGVLVSRAGHFQLSFEQGRLVWQVTTASGNVTVSSATTFAPGSCQTIKATYNSSSGTAKLLVENHLDASAQHPLLRDGQTASPKQLALAASSSDIFFGAAGAEAENGFHGQLEEIYLKNCSTESRQVYIYTDNVRPTSSGNVRVFDLSHAAGRTYYATIMSSILNAADFDTTQWDGFEILLLMPLYNFK